MIRFIGERNSAYLATASVEGQPYMQHRGGPAGCLKVLDARTVAFANYPGNSQYISIGNLAENERAFLFLMDYAEARRLKLWGRARVVSDEAGETIVFSVLAWDWNCSQHIPKLVAP